MALQHNRLVDLKFVCMFFNNFEAPSRFNYGLTEIYYVAKLDLWILGQCIKIILKKG